MRVLLFYPLHLKASRSPTPGMEDSVQKNQMEKGRIRHIELQESTVCRDTHLGVRVSVVLQGLHRGAFSFHSNCAKIYKPMSRADFQHRYSSLLLIPGNLKGNCGVA